MYFYRALLFFLLLFSLNTVVFAKSYRVSPSYIENHTLSECEELPLVKFQKLSNIAIDDNSIYAKPVCPGIYGMYHSVIVSDLSEPINFSASNAKLSPTNILSSFNEKKKV